MAKPVKLIDRFCGHSGLLAIALFFTILVFFVLTTENFDFLHTPVSHFGATGRENAYWWNFFAHLLVGILLVIFGIGYGRAVMDRWTGILLTLFGVAFAAAAVPVDLENGYSSLFTRFHVLAVLIVIACWCAALARISVLARVDAKQRTFAIWMCIAGVIGLAYFTVTSQSNALSERAGFPFIFGWVLGASIWLFSRGPIVTRRSASSVGVTSSCR